MDILDGLINDDEVIRTELYDISYDIVENLFNKKKCHMRGFNISMMG